MPGPTRSGGHHAGPRRSGFGALVASLPIAPIEVRAESLLRPSNGWLESAALIERPELAALALTLGVIVFAVIASVALVRTRLRAAAAESSARAEISVLRAEADRANALLFAEPQFIVQWPAGEDEPEILGDTALVTASPVPRRALAFGTWLDAERAQAMEGAVERLRARGESFVMPLTTATGRHVEAEGRAIGGRAVLRIRDLTGTTRELAALSARYENLLRDIEALRTLIEALPAPIWARDAHGRLAWANRAYAHAVDAETSASAIARGAELLDRPAREERQRLHGLGQPFSARIPVIVAGHRALLDVLDVPTRGGGAGIALDATEAENLRAELQRMIEAHRRTLDQLPTAVAIFGPDRRLAFYNSAYRTLWGLDAAVLEQGPTDSELLDQLRAARRLPEQVNFRQWVAQFHESYRAVEPQEQLWHLPDGRTLRVVTTPSPDGGLTYLFDDVSERLDLERRYDALIRVQGETLDHLAEAVAVFGSDGRLRLHNPIFASMWRLPPAALAEHPHIEAVIGLCQPGSNEAIWQALRHAVTGLDPRDSASGRFERADGSVIDCMTVPLPDGATLITFQDVTDSVNVERVLRERNEALEAADQLKNDFVHHVSYELRSPLTNIIGFAQLLDDKTTGPLNAKQREYIGHINSSSAALLAIINDILDLATIDAGSMTLDLAPVDIPQAMQAAADGVKDRLTENRNTLAIRVDPEIGAFVADGRRVRQVLYNLLSNAIGFSPPGESITLAADRRDETIVFSVTDHGPGIPADIVGRIFERFETHTLGSRHRGAGLGLSIVRSFVELHGGRVTIDSAVGRGTTVHCFFPIDHAAERRAAE
jgi:signal transduction histidine kinase